MLRSLNEIESIVLKAGIGAGLPLGQSEDLARTAAHLAGNRKPLEPVVAALQEPNQPIDVARGSDKLIIKSGAAAMTAPIVKDGFASGVTKARICKPQHAPLVLATLAEAGMRAQADGAKITLTGTKKPARTVGPVEVADAIWDIFADLAAKTLVPETNASRQSGAGAGLTDND